MTLHLLKLCVGVESVDDLRARQAERLDRLQADGMPAELMHRTLQTPRRRDELLAGGSLYWVIKGMIAARQPIVDLRPAQKADGRACCAIILDPGLVATRPQPRRAFQGWRYLDPADAPKDVSGEDDDLASLPPGMAEELRALCLIGD